MNPTLRWSLHDARREDVEGHVARNDRVVRPVIAGAQGEHGAGDVLHAELPDIDVLPAESRAVGAAERRAWLVLGLPTDLTPEYSMRIQSSATSQFFAGSKETPRA